MAELRSYLYLCAVYVVPSFIGCLLAIACTEVVKNGVWKLCLYWSTSLMNAARSKWGACPNCEAKDLTIAALQDVRRGLGDNWQGDVEQNESERTG